MSRRNLITFHQAFIYFDVECLQLRKDIFSAIGAFTSWNTACRICFCIFNLEYFDRLIPVASNYYLQKTCS